MFKTIDPVARRAGRFASGVVLLAGAALLAHNVIRHTLEIGVLPRISSTGLLVRTWLGAIVVGLIAMNLVTRVPGLRARVPGAVTSAVVPAVGLALWLPITIQVVASVLLFEVTSVRELDEWAVFAIAGTPLTHIGFASLVGVRAARLVTGREPPSVKRILISCVGLTVLPFALAMLVMPMMALVGVLAMFIVLATALPILPLLHAMERSRRPERAVPVLPTARLVA